MILTIDQARSVYAAMTELNKIGGRVTVLIPEKMIEVRQNVRNGVAVTQTTTSTRVCQSEYYGSQFDFMDAYGLG